LDESGFSLSLGGVSVGSDYTVSISDAALSGAHVRYNPPLNVVAPSCGATPLSTRQDKTATLDTVSHMGWQGVTPFMTLNPAHVSDKKYNYGQHGVFVWVYKPTVELTKPGLLQKFSIAGSSYKTSLDTSIGNKTILDSLGMPAIVLKGINSVATAQVYYHRPNNWREMPNLFNPFWKARLYPVIDWINSNGFDIGWMTKMLSVITFIH